MRIILFSRLEGLYIKKIINEINNCGHSVFMLVTTNSLITRYGKEDNINSTKRIQGYDFNIPILIINNTYQIESVIDYINPDLILMCSFPYLLSKNILKYKVINLHPSILPKYKGPNPFPWYILNEEKEFGFTFHYADEKFDSGNILIQEKIEIYDNINFKDEFINNSLNSISKLLKMIENNDKGIIQNQLESSYFKKLSYKERLINLENSAYDIIKLVRACSYDSPSLIIIKDNLYIVIEANISGSIYKKDIIINNQILMKTLTENILFTLSKI
jgi:methionyl-tRNA formyltransferase